MSELKSQDLLQRMMAWEAREDRRNEAARAGDHDKTKDEAQPTNTVNEAIKKESCSKDGDVETLATIAIPETVRVDPRTSMASQVDIFATVCGLHGTSARSVIMYPSQQCWCHGFSVDDSLAYIKWMLISQHNYH